MQSIINICQNLFVRSLCIIKCSFYVYFLQQTIYFLHYTTNFKIKHFIQKSSSSPNISKKHVTCLSHMPALLKLKMEKGDEIQICWTIYQLILRWTIIDEYLEYHQTKFIMAAEHNSVYYFTILMILCLTYVLLMLR